MSNSKFISLFDWAKPHKKRIYQFSEGSLEDKNLLGNKGANLCEMCRLGLPVPPGFIITTETCLEFFDEKTSNLATTWLEDDLYHFIGQLEKQSGRRFDPYDSKLKKYTSDGGNSLPLLFSVRSGAPVSMPGMMDTILNVGMNDEIVRLMIEVSHNPRWAYDTYRRFIQMYSVIVLGRNSSEFEDILESVRKNRGVKFDSELDTEGLLEVLDAFKKISTIPEDPYTQLSEAVASIFESWHAPRAVKYRDIHNIPDTLGTAVIVQCMVYGNMNDQSCSGVAFTRNPTTGEKEFYGEFLPNVEGEDVVSGIETPKAIYEMEKTMPRAFSELCRIEKILEKHYRDMQDIEFTVQNGELFILQTRTGKRTPRASVHIAVKMVEEKLITEREALMRVDPEQMDFFLHPTIDSNYVRQHANELSQMKIGEGLAASPGAAVGKIVFTCEDALTLSIKKEPCILCRNETSADDIDGLKSATGVMTLHGGLTSHAAVVMRGMGKPAVVGIDKCRIDMDRRELLNEQTGQVIKNFDLVTIDGSTGVVYFGMLPTVTAGQDECFQVILNWADKYKRMKVFANADTPEEALEAQRLGAEGIGLCRTEHMFFKPGRLETFKILILSDSEQERNELLGKLRPQQQWDFENIFRAMINKTVIVRLLDPPLHEFLPDPASADFDMLIASLANSLNISKEACCQKVREAHEKNPMMGCRGARLSIVCPEIVDMQVEAIANAYFIAVEQSSVKVQIMIPMVFSDHEVDMISERIAQKWSCTIAKLYQDITPLHGNYDGPIGTMIELPRACIRADKIAGVKALKFLSFGTNDLTQMVFGISRDDTQRFLPVYLKNHILARDPFLSIDVQAVGAMIQMAVRKSRRVNPSITIGACGEHSGDARSILFFDRIGLDYISCSPQRVPIAKIAAAQAHIDETAREEYRRNEIYRRLMSGELFL